MKIGDLSPTELHAKYEGWVSGTTNRYFRRYHYVLERDEIYNVVCLGLIKAAQSYDENRVEQTLSEPFMAYAKTVIRNELISAVKRASTKRKVMEGGNVSYRSLPTFKTKADERDIAAYDNGTQDDYVIVKDLLRKAMLGFPPEAKKAFLAHFVRGENYREISERLGCSRQNVEYHVKRIRDRFKKLYEGGTCDEFDATDDSSVL
jgi:RNA polymerase sigma factor (sigma-70 family)